VSVAELVTLYLAEWASAWAPRTLVRSRADLRHVLSFFGSRDLTRQGVIDCVRQVHAKRTPQGEPWAKRTVLGVLVRLRHLLKWALLRGYLLEELAALVALPAVETLPRTLAEEDTDRLIEAAALGACMLRDRAILETLYGTGLRAAELAALACDDLDLAAGFVYVRSGKGGRDRVVPLGECAAKAVHAYLVHERPRGAGPLYLTVQGRALSRKALGDVVARAGRRAGLLTPVSPHRLRHSYATHLLRNGASVLHVKALLGHARLASTEVYTHVDVSDLARMLERSHPRERDL
jgi:site-specific recombinase XerD